MNGRRESDGRVVPGISPNKAVAAASAAEGKEGRRPTKGNPGHPTRDRAQDRVTLQQAEHRIRQAATRDRGMQFTTLWHHVYDPARLREAFLRLERSAAPGVDGETWSSYAEDLDARIEDLSARLKRGAYRAKPVRRTYLAKPDGGQRPLGVPVLEDKLVQSATVEVLNAIYEVDFVGFSYGFRPRRSQHDALDALSMGLMRKKVSWVLDADIRGFFDAIDHEWLMRFVEHRIADRRVLRHLRKWLKAGVLEKGQWKASVEGTPQGGSISPLLANVYLHYVLDDWIRSWRKRHARGDVIVVRYADDFIVGFQHQREAERFLTELGARLRKFGLDLHPTKTRLLEFGRFASENRARRGERKPETFDFLGFTHICGKTRRGRFIVRRKTMRKRRQRKLRALAIELRRRKHHSVPEVGRWLASVLRGHYRYYGVPYNSPSLRAFYSQLIWLWYSTLRRRSQRSRTTWPRMRRLAERWLPPPRIYHPYPWERLCV